ncbi:hypothetical protein MKX03_028440 [Papaver bracteatum]|nr:hypothetical protein MKX03_028440 [Papaver bracteatum]
MAPLWNCISGRCKQLLDNLVLEKTRTIEDDEDILWEADVRESRKAVATSGMEFINCAFLLHTLSAFGDDCHLTMRQEIRKLFANCELRSVVIVDSGLIGSDTSVTNYPGKIPSGLESRSS